MKGAREIIETLTSVVVIVTFCGYLSAYGFYSAVLINLFKGNIQITSLMGWDEMLVQGIFLIVRFLIIGIAGGLGLYLVRVNFRARRSYDVEYIFPEHLVTNALILAGAIVFFLLPLVNGLAFKDRWPAPLFFMGINTATAFTISYLVYHVKGAFHTYEDPLYKLASVLLTITTILSLFFIISAMLGSFDANRMSRGEIEVPYPRLGLTLKSEVEGLDRDGTKTTLTYNVRLFSEKGDTLYIIATTNYVLHGIKKDLIEHYFFYQKGDTNGLSNEKQVSKAVITNAAKALGPVGATNNP